MLSHLRLIGLHLVTTLTPQLSSRSCLPSVPGGDVLSGRGTVVEDGDGTRDPRVWEPRVPLHDQLPCGLLCTYQRTPLRGIIVLTPQVVLARHSPSLELPAAPQADPAQQPIAYMAVLMGDFSKRMSLLERNDLAESAAPEREASPACSVSSSGEEPKGPLFVALGTNRGTWLCEMKDGSASLRDCVLHLCRLWPSELCPLHLL
jgi:hypothetical protein